MFPAHLSAVQSSRTSETECSSSLHNLERRRDCSASGPKAIRSFVYEAVASNTLVSLGCVPFACITKMLFPKPTLVVSRGWRPLVVIE